MLTTLMLPLQTVFVPLSLWDDFLGFLNTIMQPLYWAVSWILVAFHWFFSLFMDPDWGWTWALSIVLLTMVIRTALIPLFVRQINSSRNMQLLQPKVKALQDKYGADREKLGQETMKLYKEEGVNPMASCLPIVLQAPVFMALFWVLRNTSTGDAMGYFTQDKNLMESLQHAQLMGAQISRTFWPVTQWTAVQTIAAILIVLMVVALFVNQLQLMRKNMPPEAMTGPMAQQQKMMLYVFPLIYLFTGVNIPIGVLFYWLTTNLWTMGQQFLLIHNNPAPNTPAYIDWEERLRARGKDPDAILAKRRGGKKKAAPAAYDPTKVARQSTPATAAAPEDGGASAKRGGGGAVARQAKAQPSSAAQAPPVEAASDQPAKLVVHRQQPTKTSRAKRKS